MAFRLAAQPISLVSQQQRRHRILIQQPRGLYFLLTSACLSLMSFASSSSARFSNPGSSTLSAICGVTADVYLFYFKHGSSGTSGEAYSSGSGAFKYRYINSSSSGSGAFRAFPQVRQDVIHSQIVRPPTMTSYSSS